MFVALKKQEQFRDEKMVKAAVVDSPRMFCDLYCLKPAQFQKVHAHEDADKIYVVQRGRPTLIIGEQEKVLEAGELAYAAPGVPHGVRNDTDEEAICLVFMTPRP